MYVFVASSKCISRVLISGNSMNVLADGCLPVVLFFHLKYVLMSFTTRTERNEKNPISYERSPKRGRNTILNKTSASNK